jgi:hypothetical protein
MYDPRWEPVVTVTGVTLRDLSRALVFVIEHLEREGRDPGDFTYEDVHVSGQETPTGPGILVSLRRSDWY